VLASIQQVPGRAWTTMMELAKGALRLKLKIGADRHAWTHLEPHGRHRS
jgi:hypothetical protein